MATKTVKIRQNVFETNSSSTHSVVIAYAGEGDLMDTLYVDSDGVLTVPYGEFGWEVESYNDPGTKASYCATWIVNSGNKEEAEGFKNIFEFVLKIQTGATKVEYSNTSYGDTGYIDHQSWDVCKDVFENPETLRQFIFNPRSILRTDNDNH